MKISKDKIKSIQVGNTKILTTVELSEAQLQEVSERIQASRERILRDLKKLA